MIFLGLLANIKCVNLNFLHFDFFYKLSLQIMNTTHLSEKDFEVLKELGSGSFGIVHLVRKLTDNKQYAIKSVQLARMGQK